MEAILVILCLVLIGGTTWLTLQNKALEEKVLSLELTANQYRRDYMYILREYNVLKMNNHFSNLNLKQKPTEIPKGTIDAVKLAMKVSHPDNGGNQDDFIKYREVYQRLTGKRG